MLIKRQPVTEQQEGFVERLAQTLGGIAEKPVVMEGEIKIRECLNLTADFDHDVVDGAPAARFIEHFKGLLESGDGLA